MIVNNYNELMYAFVYATDYLTVFGGEIAYINKYEGNHISHN